MASRRSSRTASRTASRDPSPVSTPVASSSRGGRKPKAAPTAAPSSPTPSLAEDTPWEALVLPDADDVFGAFRVSPDGDAGDVEPLAPDTPASAPPTAAKPAPVGQLAGQMELPHLLRSTIEELENLLRMDANLATDVVAQPTRIDVMKLILTKKRCEKKKAGEIAGLRQEIKTREESLKVSNTELQATKIRANHAAQNKHLQPEVVQLRVRPPLPPHPLGPTRGNLGGGRNLLPAPPPFPCSTHLSPRLILLPFARRPACRR